GRARGPRRPRNDRPGGVRHRARELPANAGQAVRRAALAVGLLLAWAGSARAQIGGRERNFGGTQPGAHRSPENWAFELRFGPYRPDVDSEFGGRTMPYQEFFGSGASLLFGFEVDYQLWHRFGSFGIGGSFGWFSDSNKACAPATCNVRIPGDE